MSQLGRRAANHEILTAQVVGIRNFGIHNWGCLNSLHLHYQPSSHIAPTFMFSLTASRLLGNLHGRRLSLHCPNLPPDVHITPHLNQKVIPGPMTKMRHQAYPLEHPRAFQERADRLLALQHLKSPNLLVEHYSKLSRAMPLYRNFQIHRKKEKDFVQVGKSTWKG